MNDAAQLGRRKIAQLPDQPFHVTRYPSVEIFERERQWIPMPISIA